MANVDLTAPLRALAHRGTRQSFPPRPGRYSASPARSYRSLWCPRSPEDTYPEFKLVLIIHMMVTAGRMSGLFKDDATPTQIQSDLHTLLGEVSRQQHAGAPAPNEYRNPG